MFTNIKVGARLAWGFGVVLVFMLAIAVSGVISLGKINDEMEVIVNYENVRTQLVNDMIDTARQGGIEAREIIIGKYNNMSNSKLQFERSLLSRERAAYADSLNKVKDLMKDDAEGLASLKSLDASAAAVRALEDRTIELALANRGEEAAAIMFNELIPATAKWIAGLDAMIHSENQRTLARHSGAEKLYSRMLLLISVLGLAAFLLTIILSVMLTRSITDPLKTSLEAADRIATKDLSVDLSMYKGRGDEMGTMLQSFGKMGEMLKTQMREIMEGVNMLTSASSEILAATTQVSTSAAENATAVSETTTTVEEVRQAAQLSSQKAKNVSENSQALGKISQNGLKAVDENSAAMNRIQAQMESIAKTIVNLGEQTQSIGGIIAAITDIADQCNLLAVNAGIEAAKAGEQGRGFAVVAQELRSLAEQSKQGTSEVRRILNDVQKATNSAILVTEQGSNTVEAGVRQAALAGEAIRALTDSTSQAVQAAIQIAASSQQQGIGMDQIGKAMENVNQATTENMASMKQTEAAAKIINELGQKLKHLVSQYKM